MPVLETEKVHSQMLDKLLHKDELLDISENDNIKYSPATSPSKTKETLLKHPKSPCRGCVSVNEETSKSPTTVTPSIEENKSCANKKPKLSQTDSDTVEIIKTVGESDESEPRKVIPIPTLSRHPDKAEKFVSCQSQDSEESSTSSSSTVCSSSMSDDSSGASESSVITVVQKVPISTATSTSEVTSYDHGTLQTNTSGTTPTTSYTDGQESSSEKESDFTGKMTIPSNVPKEDQVGKKIDLMSLFGRYSTIGQTAQTSSNNG